MANRAFLFYHKDGDYNVRFCECEPLQEAAR